MPILTLPRLLLSILSLAILGGAVYLLWSWQHGYDVRDVQGVWRHVRGPAWRLYAGSALLAWSFLGRFVVLAAMRGSKTEASLERGASQIVVAPDGSRLEVEIFGRADGPTLVFTHGWGLDSTIWAWARRDLSRRFRIVTWDLPGLGRSGRPPDGEFSIDRFADALGTVIEQTSERPVIVVGHSIGGMTTQTLFRARPDLAKTRVAGVVLLNTTYENPLRTMALCKLWLALQRPLLEPICWLTVFLLPIAWLSNWQSYLSGHSQLAMRLAGFGRYATRKQVDATALLATRNSPAVQAKGNLAMFHWQAREVLPSIPVPVLVIAGSRDIVTLPAAAEVIRSRAPQAELVVVDGVGHMGFLERAEDYHGQIDAFAERVFLTSSYARPADRRGSRPISHPPGDEHRIH